MVLLKLLFTEGHLNLFSANSLELNLKPFIVKDISRQLRERGL